MILIIEGRSEVVQARRRCSRQGARADRGRQEAPHDAGLQAPGGTQG